MAVDADAGLEARGVEGVAAMFFAAGDGDSPAVAASAADGDGCAGAAGVVDDAGVRVGEG